MLLYVFRIVSALPTEQDSGLCGIIAATNIQSVPGYSQWSCTSDGITAFDPCITLWPAASCNGYNVTSLSFYNIGFSGWQLQINVFQNILLLSVGSIPSSIGLLTMISSLDYFNNKLTGDFFGNLVLL